MGDKSRDGRREPLRPFSSCVPSPHPLCRKDGAGSRIHAGCHRQHRIVEKEEAQRATYSRAWMRFKSERAGRSGWERRKVGGRPATLPPVIRPDRQIGCDSVDSAQ